MLINRSLYSKLVMTMIVLIFSLMFVVGAFLMQGVRDFYLKEFFTQISTVFSKSELAADLRAAADEDNGEESMLEKLGAYSGQLGIDSGTRNFYILDDTTGAYLAGSDDSGGELLDITPNILKALNGQIGDSVDNAADYMDVAIPVEGSTGGYIVYIKDNKKTMRELNKQLFAVIVTSLLFGLVITVFLSMLLAKAMVTPIQSLTRAAERLANGDFSRKPENPARDEIGVLTDTFNEMAYQLETTLNDLNRSEMTRREFVANVSHELRTPITSIRSYAETLEETEDLPKETERGFLRVIVNESDRMTKIVQDLLTLSRFDAGSFEMSFDWFHFDKSVSNVYDAMLLEAQRRDQRFTLSIEDDIPLLYGDKARVEQVLMNIVSNSLKYTHIGGNIELTAGHDEEYVWARVRDNGMGIPADDVPRVFERFYRVDRARSRESGGTGLGLAISQEIIAMHGGTLELESRELAGTTVTITIPADYSLLLSEFDG